MGNYERKLATTKANNVYEIIADYRQAMLHILNVAKTLWSWRESNPRPDEENRCFLHAYSSVNFRYLADVGQPTRYLST